MAVWKTQEVKTEIGSVTNDASVEELRGTEHQPDLRAYLLGGPKVDSFEIPRDRDTGRDANLLREP